MHLGVFMEETTESISSDDLDIGVDRVGERSERAGLVQGPVRPVRGEVAFVLGEDLAQVRGVDDQHSVQDFAAYAADPPFHDRVHARCLGSGEHNPDPLGPEHFIEQSRELVVPVPDHEFKRSGPLTQLRHQVPGLLGDPPGGGMGGDAQDVHRPGVVLDHRKAVQPREHDRLHVEEVAGEDPLCLGAQELPPAQPSPDRRGAGSIPAFFKIAHTVDGATLWPSPASSPAIRL
jgi:hypothetical protein